MIKINSENVRTIVLSFPSNYTQAVINVSVFLLTHKTNTTLCIVSCDETKHIIRNISVNEM